MIRTILTFCLVAGGLRAASSPDDIAPLVATPGSHMLSGSQVSSPSGPFAPLSLKQIPRDQFQRMFAKSFEGQFGSKKRPMNSKDQTSSVCSIPLRVMKVAHPERFTMKILPGGNGNFDRIAGPTPAPACKNFEGR